jgi:hypothetical protein
LRSCEEPRADTISQRRANLQPHRRDWALL